MDLKVQNHPKADSSNTCTIHSNLSLHKLRGCLPNFSYMFPSTSKDWGMPRQRLNPRPAPPIESKVHSPSFAGDPGNVHGIRWTRHCCLPSLGTNTYPPIQKKKRTFLSGWFFTFQGQDMLNVGFLDGILFAYCRLFSSKLPASKCSTFTNLYSMWMKFEGFASPSPPRHSKLIKWIWQHQYISIWFVNDLFCWWVSLPPQGISWVQDCRHWIQLRVLPGSRRHLGPRVPAPGSGQVFGEVEEISPPTWLKPIFFVPRWDTKNPSNMGSFTQNGIFGRIFWCRKSFLPSAGLEFPSNTRTCNGVTRSI